MYDIMAIARIVQWGPGSQNESRRGFETLQRMNVVARCPYLGSISTGHRQGIGSLISKLSKWTCISDLGNLQVTSCIRSWCYRLVT